MVKGTVQIGFGQAAFGRGAAVHRVVHGKGLCAGGLFVRGVTACGREIELIPAHGPATCGTCVKVQAHGEEA